MWRFVILLALLAGCSDTVRPDRSAKRAARKDAAQSLANQPAARQVYRFDSGELQVLDIATVTSGATDSQRCFLWRDQEFKTASLQCPNDSPADLPLGGSTPDSIHP